MKFGNIHYHNIGILFFKLYLETQGISKEMLLQKSKIFIEKILITLKVAIKAQIDLSGIRKYA